MSEGPIKPNYLGGPHGLGDPNDRTLRRVEREVLIPKIMRDRGRLEKCTEEVGPFEACCKKNGIFMVVTCRKENNALKECLEKWYKNEQFRNECTEIYLKDRSEFRSTGLTKKQRQQLI